VINLSDTDGQWLQVLPALLDYSAKRWSLTILPPFENLSYHYVAPVVLSDGTEAVLKVGLGDIGPEVRALRAFDGRGCVRLIDTDIERGVMLLEKLRPGAVLTSLANEHNDETATSIAASVMRKLWGPPSLDCELLTIDDWEDGIKGFVQLRNRCNGGTGPMPLKIVDYAEGLFSELSSSASEKVVLHGDLHHDNIVSAEREPWLAIDPKGVIGEPAYEIGAILRNLWMDKHVISNPKRLIERRIHQFGDILGLDKKRIRDWAIAQGVLSVIWGIDYEDRNWRPDLRGVETLRGIEVG
jgi:streptomycin 6-kinase